MKHTINNDEFCRALWCKFADVPMNPITECIEEDFYIWPSGTFREDIWFWFDTHYSKGVANLMYNTTSYECGDCAFYDTSKPRLSTCGAFFASEERRLIK